MKKAEKVAEAIRCEICKHKSASLFEIISALEVVKLEVFEMLPKTIAGVRSNGELDLVKPSKLK